jgi:hypothetical protein
MKAPNYITNSLHNAEFYFGEDGCVGYSIKIFKHTRYENANTLRIRCAAIIGWCNNQIPGSAEMVSYPKVTHYTQQFAVITIYDPVMLYLEKFIKAAAR